MALTESLDLFLADFGVDVTLSGGSVVRAIFDHPDEVIADGMVMSTGYRLTVKSSAVAALANGSTVTIAGSSYRVRSVRQLDDGSFSEVSLSKV